MSRSRRYEARETLILAWPMIISQLAQVGTGFADTAMSGHASVVDLAAVSVGSSVWIALMVTLMGLLQSVSPIVSQKVGAGRFDEIPGIIQQALWQGAILAIGLIVVVRLMLPIFDHVGLEREAADKAREFLSAVSWGLPAFAVFRVFYGYCASLNRTRPLMMISIVGLLINIFVNWLLIFGNWGFPALGAVGCAYATALGMWVSAALLVSWVGCNSYYRSTSPLCALRGWDWDMQWQLFKLGVLIGVVFLVEVTAFSLTSLLIARLGATTVAAHQIGLNFTAMVFMVPSALSNALTVRVGQALGAGQPERARFIGSTGIEMAIAYAAVSASLICIFNDPIARLYTQDAAVRMLAAGLLLLAGVFQLADATQVVIAGILRGYKVTRSPMVIYVAAFWVIGIPLGYWFAFGGAGLPAFGVRGYWVALVIALATAAASLYWVFKRESARALARPA